MGTFEDFVQPLTTSPGRTLPAWLISDVTVSPDHRRRGVLRALMLRSLADALAAGVPVAALTASEAGIYGRFGFGAATRWRETALDVAGEPGLTGEEAERSVTRAGAPACTRPVGPDRWGLADPHRRRRGERAAAGPGVGRGGAAGRDAPSGPSAAHPGRFLRSPPSDSLSARLCAPRVAPGRGPRTPVQTDPRRVRGVARARRSSPGPPPGVIITPIGVPPT
ncbi:GNAT family N-acetyltransferase [Micrococcus sp.]|uniref:GNAT family N-acetyltransferase n=1 Tax=Micrococcus sp. TaxID=1271 RepID=UPI0039C5BCF9